MEKNPNLSTITDILWIPICSLIGYGLVMVFSASYLGDNSYFWKQLLWTIVGGSILFLILRMNYNALQKCSPYLLIATIIILFLTLFFPKKGGATRWIFLGPLSIQPAEFVKVFFILYLSYLLSKKSVTNPLKRVVVPILLFSAIITILLLQPHIGMIFLMFILTFVFLFVSGMKGRWLLLTGIAMAIVFWMVVAIRPYALERIMKKDGWQVEQSTIAIGSGGFSGVGIGESRQKLPGLLPTPQTDFIFSIIGEEMGFLGSFFVIACLFLFSTCGFLIAYWTQSPAGSFLAFGLTLSIIAEALINLYVVLGSLPTTGLPLPFISYGGSSLISDLIACGLIMRVGYSEER